MLGNILPPYHTLQELNLDWILTKVKNMLRFLPDDGAVGQILRRTQTGAEWSDEQGGGGAVDSVNGQTGTVVLDKNDIGLGNVDDVQQYSASNPPPYPVTSVNSQTGAVSLSIPDSTSDLVNDSGFVDAAGAAAAAPVQSVNSQTGAVTLSIPDSTSDLVNDSGFVDAAGAAAAAPVQSVNSQTGAVSLPKLYEITYQFYNLTQYTDSVYYIRIPNALTTAGVPNDALVVSVIISGWSGLGQQQVNLARDGDRGLYVLHTPNYNIPNNSYVDVKIIYSV